MKRTSTVVRYQTFFVLLLATSLILTSCSSPSTAPATEAPLKTFTFGAATNPSTLDPAATSDADSLRVSRQIMEPLISLDRTSGEPVPALATSWAQSEDHLTITFTLRENVQFHDGTAFDAAAVCANFNRWERLSANLTRNNPDNQYKTLFKTTSGPKETSIYQSCASPNPTTATITFSQPYPSVIRALGQPAFAIASPQAFEKQETNNPEETNPPNPGSDFGEHPVGTGPYVLSSWTPEEITLTQNETYWGKKSNVNIVKFKTIDTAHGRVEALTNNEIDAIDYISAEQYDLLLRQIYKGNRVLPRDPYSVLYLSINKEHGPLKNPLLRKAIAQALERNSIMTNSYIHGSNAAYQFLPPRLTSFGATTGMPAHDVDEAKKLLAESKYNGEAIPFYYPINISKIYLPEPEKIFADISKQLTAIGLNIKPVPIDYDQNYCAKIQDDDHGLSLIGINGMYQDPDSFLGTLLSSAQDTSHYTNPQIMRLLNEARRTPEERKRNSLYKQIQGILDKDLPAVPIVFPISAAATGPRVLSYPISPIMDETFNYVTLE